MTFDELLAEIAQLLQCEHRLSYRGLKRRFTLDDDLLEDLKEELIGAKRIARDEDGRFLVHNVDTSPSAAPNVRVDTPPAKMPDAERRQLTVMFCDLVGSTALSTQLDPEELRDVVRAYQETCTESIRRYEGHVTQHLGDGLLVYFGFPNAHEDDPQRAVLAALEVVASVSARCFASLPEGNVPLKVRVGIHTGLVVIGDIGGRDRHEMLALGETPNLAARLQSAAKPNSVVISEATERLVQGVFECRTLAVQRLKGLSAPVRAFRVIRTNHAAAPKGLVPLVGRVAEIDKLHAAWIRAQRGSGECVFLSGEPGIGKSRLLRELREAVGSETTIRIELRCSAYHQNSALYPIIDHLQRVLEFRRDQSPQSRFVKLAQRLRPYRFPRSETPALLADLLSLPLPVGLSKLALRPQKQKSDTMEALVDWICEDAERLPVLLICEDLQWADASTLELIQLLLDRTLTSKVLLVFSFRPEFRPAWRLTSPATDVALVRLNADEIVELVSKVTAGRSLPEEVLSQIATKTDGVPLFVEELTKMVMESDLLRQVDGAYELARPLREFAIPTSIQDSLTARLDRVASVREIAQLGAVLGREFSYEMIRATAPFDDETLISGLRQLVDAELLIQRGLPPQVSYTFRHALVRDAAYQRLLKNRRRQMHETAARLLEDSYREIAEAQPEIVAHHYTEAGIVERAILHWQRAAHRAAQRSAYIEAMSHLTRGLALSDGQPDSLEQRAQELALRSVLGPVLIAVKGWRAAETRASYVRVRDLSAQLGQTPQLFRALSGIVSANILDGHLHAARELADQLPELATQARDPLLEIEAHNSLGITMLYLGAPPQAYEHLEHAVAIDEASGSSPRMPGGMTAQNPSVAARAHMAVPLWMLGRADQALQSSQRALCCARDLAHPFSIAYALLSNALVHSFRGEPTLAFEMAAELIALCRDHGFSQLWRGSAISVLGWAKQKQNRSADGIADMRVGIAQIRESGTELVVPYYLSLLAAAYCGSGQIDDGLAALEDGVAVVERTSERLWEAELHRQQGELRRCIDSRDRAGEAEERFGIALATARQQGAVALELRTVTSLARLWRAQGKTLQAHDLVTGAIDRFHEGLSTADLLDAKAILVRTS